MTIARRKCLHHHNLFMRWPCQLKLYAYVEVNNTEQANGVYSKGFSVAAIPIGVEASINLLADGTDFPTADQYRFFWGAEYALKIKSDSGDPRDLDQVQVNEDLDKGTATGAMIPYAGGFNGGVWYQASLGGYDKNFIARAVNKADAASEAAAKGQVVDDIRADIDAAKDNKGHWDIDQDILFFDQRTGMDEKHAVIVAASGFHLTYDLSKVSEKGQTRYMFTIQRTAKANRGAAAGGLAAASDGEAKPSEIK